jgi:NAD-dependent SIR2 family protein deacetylase
VTQNVDQLHYKAGSRNVTELHGTNSVIHPNVNGFIFIFNAVLISCKMEVTWRYFISELKLVELDQEFELGRHI